MTHQHVAELFHKHPFRFAKTMPDNPHFYTLRKDWDDETFVQVVEFIRENSTIGYFNSRKYQYYDINGCVYWTMGEPINKDGKPWTILINRKDKMIFGSMQHEVYDAFAEQYSAFFNYENKFINENLELKKVLDSLMPENAKVLDIGCGDGLFSSLFPTKEVIGIDPSIKMLQAFKSRPFFDLRKHLLLCEKAERFFPYGEALSYDVVVSTFGSCNYVEQSHLNRLIKGKPFILMYYKTNYTPVTHVEFNVSATSFEPEIYHPHRNIEFNNYIIKTNLG